MADLIMAFFYLIGGILSNGQPDSDSSPRWEGGRNINRNNKRPYWNSKS